MRKSLTAAFVKAVKPGTERSEYWDDGLGLRVAESGTKSWSVMYRHRRQLRRLTIGTYPELSLTDARAAARRTLRAAQLGEDPGGEKKANREALTFGELAKHYLETYARTHKR